MIDSHCHIDFPAFDGNRQELIERAQKSGIKGIIAPAISAEHWPRLAHVSATFASVFPAYGLHPVFIESHEDRHLEQLETWLSSEGCVAIGECGLDFHRERPDLEKQQRIFSAHLELAQLTKLPLIIHARQALDAVLNLIKKYPGVQGVIHSFSGSLQQAQQAIDLGFMLGVGGAFTYDRAQRLKRTLKCLPRHALLLESDAPDQPDQQWRFQEQGHNRPERVRYIAEQLALLRDEPFEELMSYTERNTHALFGLGVAHCSLEK